MIRHIISLSSGAALLVCGQVMAQSVAPPAPAALATPGPPVTNGEGLYWPSQVQRQALPADREVAMATFAWTPSYRVSVLRRAHYVDPARAHPKMLEDKTQIYFIISGSGTQVLGGRPARETSVVDGNHNGDGPLAEGKSFHIAAGDVVVIPPHTWHQTLQDAGPPIVYQMVDVKTPTRMP